MLKARSPERCAGFVAELCGQLRNVVFDCFRVLDKFTGDGILACSSDFYSGQDAGFHALVAAERYHAVFERHYRANRTAFMSVLKQAGLGIGIDYGSVSMVQVGTALTVVGVPVVYACRMGGAPAGPRWSISLHSRPWYDPAAPEWWRPNVPSADR
jgi:class 3 adenylate cyclase